MEKWYLRQSDFKGKTEVTVLNEDADNEILCIKTTLDNHNEIVKQLNNLVFEHNQCIRKK